MQCAGQGLQNKASRVMGEAANQNTGNTWLSDKWNKGSSQDSKSFIVQTQSTDGWDLDLLPFFRQTLEP